MFKKVFLSLLLVLGLTIPAMAQDYGAPEGDQEQYHQQGQPQESYNQQEEAPVDFSEEEIEKVATAYVDIIDIREKYHGQLSEVEDPEAAREIQIEANEEITKAVKDNGVEIETYNSVISAAQTNEELMNNLLSRIEKLKE